MGSPFCPSAPVPLIAMGFPFCPSAPVPFRRPWPTYPCPVQLFGLPPCPPGVRIRQVMAHNVRAEVRMIRSLLDSFPYIAVDTEYPGTVQHPPRGTRNDRLKVEQRYALVKANVDELHLLQLGITLCDEQGRLPVGPDEHGNIVQYAWQVNFSDFDINRDSHAPESVAFLRSQGFDFESVHVDGVTAEAFAHELDRCGFLRCSVSWITYGGLYDAAYLIKLVTGGQALPVAKVDFLLQLGMHFGGKVYDVKFLASLLTIPVRGSLKAVAQRLGVPQLSPAVHLAGPNSVLTCHAFMEVRRRFSLPQDDFVRLGLEIHGLED